MKSTSINRLYDQYLDKDFQFGDANLNPQRDMLYDQIDDVERRVQAVADNIIKRKLANAQEKAKSFNVSTSEGNLSTENSPRSKGLKVMTGTSGNNYVEPLPNFIVPKVLKNQGDLDLLLEPYKLDCDYSQFLYGDDETDLDDKKKDNSSNNGSGSNNSGDSDGSSGDSDLSSSDDCSKIELSYLKVLLILVKILKILRKIYDFVFSLINPIIEIVMLALQCWINPPSAAVISQKLVSLIMAIVTMLVNQIIQIIWNLLNMDCVTDTTLDLINQVKNTLNDLTDAVGLFSPQSLGLFNDIDQLVGQFDTFKEMIEEKKEAWAALKDEDWFGDFADPFKDFSKQLGNAALDGVKQSPAASAYYNIIAGGKDVASAATELGNEVSGMPSAWEQACDEFKEKYEKADEAQKDKNEMATMSTLEQKGSAIAGAQIKTKSTM